MKKKKTDCLLGFEKYIDLSKQRKTREDRKVRDVHQHVRRCNQKRMEERIFNFIYLFGTRKKEIERITGCKRNI